jgi:hypothetical protein
VLSEIRGHDFSARAAASFADHASTILPITSRPVIRVGVPSGSAMTPCADEISAEASLDARPDAGSAPDACRNSRTLSAKISKLAMDYSDLLLKHTDAVDEAGFATAAHLMDLAALGLGARGDLAMQAQRGGLRAVRLKAVLMILQKRFAEPDFSAQKLAAAAGLSERYVNELLYEAAPGSPCA